MGGRGGGSGRGSSALDTKDVGELRQYMQDHYSVTVHSSADKVDFGVLLSAAGELEGLLKEFPQAAIGIHELNGSESRSNAYASASLSGKLQLNPKMMGDQAKLDQSYENDVRVMGRDAAGVRGIRLDDGDEVVSAAVAAEGKSLLTVTENGYGKRTAVESYLRGEDRQPQTRGGKGLRNYRLTEKTGLVAGAAIVDDTNDVMLIESGGVVLRTPAASINLYGRDTQGVILMRIEEGNRVIGVEAISNTEETEESGEE